MRSSSAVCTAMSSSRQSTVRPDVAGRVGSDLGRGDPLPGTRRSPLPRSTVPDPALELNPSPVSRAANHPGGGAGLEGAVLASLRCRKQCRLPRHSPRPVSAGDSAASAPEPLPAWATHPDSTGSVTGGARPIAAAGGSAAGDAAAPEQGLDRLAGHPAGPAYPGPGPADLLLAQQGSGAHPAHDLAVRGLADVLAAAGA